MVNAIYQETDIGRFPSDWTFSILGNKVKIYRGGSPRPIQEYITDLEDGVNWIKIGDVKENDKYITSTKEKIIPEGVSNSRKVSKGDFILSNSMSFGRPYILKVDGCIHDGWLTIQEYENYFDTDYLYYMLSSELVYRQYINMAAGSSVKNLNKEKVAELLIAFPSKDEQKRIAEKLSDIDNLISTLEKQIAKKKAIKQGVMQELLSGKRRLAGFKKKWENKKLQEYCSLITKQTGFDYTAYIKPALINQKLPNTLPMIQTINFQGREFSFDTDYYIPKEIAEQFPNIILNSKCVLFSIVGASVGNIGLYPGGKAFCGGAIGITRFIDEEDAEWVYYYMCSTGGQEQIQFVTKGGAQATVTIADIRNFLIPTPEKEERKMIVSVLSEIDSEIKALEKKLEKYIGLKQGMMEQLLTGKIRLV